MRFIVIALVLLTYASAQQSKPSVRSKDASIEKRNSQQKTGAVQQDPANNPAALIGSCLGCFAEQNPDAENKQTEPYNAKTDTLYRIYLGATIAGVLFALGGILMIYRQTSAIKESTKATQYAVELQQVALRQWVNTRNWASHIFSAGEHPERLRIGVDIVNPTRAPITILWIRIITPRGNMSAGGFPQNAMLLPDNPHRREFEVEMTPAERNSFLSIEGLALPLNGSICYADSLGDKWEQQFQLILQCGLTGTQPSEYVHTLHPVK
jgi:hypothetical protein